MPISSDHDDLHSGEPVQGTSTGSPSPRPLEVPKARFAIPATAANRLSTQDVSKREDHQGNRGNAGGSHGGTRQSRWSKIGTSGIVQVAAHQLDGRAMQAEGPWSKIRKPGFSSVF